MEDIQGVSSKFTSLRAGADLSFSQMFQFDYGDPLWFVTRPSLVYPLE